MIKIPLPALTSAKQCQISIDDGLLSRLHEYIRLDNYSHVGVITDAVIEKAILPQLKPALPANAYIITVPAGEQAKSIETVVTIWKDLLAKGFDRKSILINIGGGVITDMGAFVASTFMRGIEYIQIPTTLLAQVDASVGGKTGINVGGVKNSVGTFYYPSNVVIDVNTLTTLPDREFVSGFAEIIKHGLIADAEYFKFTTFKKPREYTKIELMNIIEKSVRIKASIEQTDKYEELGPRKLLNFGHTVGHAIEAAMLDLNTPILHGEAISVGMLAEAKLSEMVGLIPQLIYTEVKQALVNAGLPVVFTTVSIDTIMQKIKFDKKNENGIVKWTLLTGIGQAKADVEAPDEMVRLAIQSLQS